MLKKLILASVIAIVPALTSAYAAPFHRHHGRVVVHHHYHHHR